MASLGMASSWDTSEDSKPKNVSLSTSLLERGGGDNWNSPAASVEAICAVAAAGPSGSASAAAGGCLFAPTHTVLSAQSLVASSSASIQSYNAGNCNIKTENSTGGRGVYGTDSPGIDSHPEQTKSLPDSTVTAQQNCLKTTDAASVAEGHATTTIGNSGATFGGPPPSLEYFEELVRDRKQLVQLPGSFQHLNKLLEIEIDRVKSAVNVNEGTQPDGGDYMSDDGLPEPVGDMVTRQERITVPVDKYPEYNFAGRILGPRGMTVKQLEQKTGCRILVRGRGSLKSRASGDSQEREELHVMVIVEDTANRAQIKLDRAKQELEKLLNPGNEGMDDLKKKQLMELAIINGTYRPPPHLTAACASNNMNSQHRGILRPPHTMPGFTSNPTGSWGTLQHHSSLSAVTAGGAPLMLSTTPGMPPGTLMGQHDPAALVGAPQSFLSGFQTHQPGVGTAGQPYVLAQLAPPPGTPSAAAAVAAQQMQQMAAAGSPTGAGQMSAMIWPQTGAVPGTVYLPWLTSGPAAGQLNAANFSYLTGTAAGYTGYPATNFATGYSQVGGTSSATGYGPQPTPGYATTNHQLFQHYPGSNNNNNGPPMLYPPGTQPVHSEGGTAQSSNASGGSHYNSAATAQHSSSGAQTNAMAYHSDSSTMATGDVAPPGCTPQAPQHGAGGMRVTSSARQQQINEAEYHLMKQLNGGMM